MSFFSILETLLIGPLKLIFEIIFQVAYEFVCNPGIAIILLSLSMNILVLPLYRRADAMQEQARDIEDKLRDGVTHIKKTFSGDERMMMLQAYYRQNNYNPANVLKGSISLLLEIPFFMAAYQFLSHLSTLEGVPFGPIKNLGAPDALLTIGGFTINMLPVLMTLINIISSAIYLKGFPLKTKIQLYGMALFFLVFLYTSPAGLVFYWTLNNVFSLVKNIFYKLKNPQKVLMILASIIGAGALLTSLVASKIIADDWKYLLIIIGVILQLPIIIHFVKSKLSFKSCATQTTTNKKLFVAAGVFLTVFTGLLIPSNFIAASPQEYVDVTYFHHPLWYVVSSVCLAAGTFLLWLGVFYWLASDKIKVVFERIMWILCGVATVNYMFFGTDLGIISADLQYENGLNFSIPEQIKNILIITVLIIILLIIIIKWAKASQAILLTATIALTLMSGMNIITVKKSVDEIKVQENIYETENAPHFELSKEGNNVVVIMLDRAMGEYIPYLFNENEELEEKFDGFTYYSNAISFGGHTNMGVPALMGGYEYTPVEINKRDRESLKSKHNESLKVMPVLFSDNGYNVTVCDAPYANYQWIPDMSIYDEYPEINTYITKGYFGNTEMKQQTIQNNYRNFFCFSLMKSAPLFMQFGIYSGGDYNMAYNNANATAQNRNGISVSTGLSKAFMEPYDALRNLNTMTDISNGTEDNFVFFYNDTTHEPMLLKEPEYKPAFHVDNTKYDAENKDRFTVDGKTINITTDKQMIHYQTNMATLMQIGEWLDYLRESDVYDNTRIIIVADHGYYLYQTEILDHSENGVREVDISNYFPLMMVKDFNSTGFKTSDEFMTNADVPTIATEGIIENPINPFTNNPINSDEKTAHDQFIMTSHDWRTTNNNGNTFSATGWAVVTNNIWDRNDWQFIDKEVVLKEHEIH